MKFQLFALFALSVQDSNQTLFFLGPLLGGLFGGGGGGGLFGGFGGGSKGSRRQRNQRRSSSNNLQSSSNIQSISSSQTNTGINSFNGNRLSNLNPNQILNSVSFVRPRESLSSQVNRGRNVNIQTSNFDIPQEDVNWLDEQDDGSNVNIRRQTNSNSNVNLNGNVNGDNGRNLNIFLINKDSNKQGQVNTQRRTTNSNDLINALKNLNNQNTNSQTRVNTSRRTSSVNTNLNSNRDADIPQIDLNLESDQPITVNNNGRTTGSSRRTTVNTKRVTNTNSGNSRQNNVNRLVEALQGQDMPELLVNGQRISANQFIQNLLNSDIFINGQKISPDIFLKALNGQSNLMVNGLDETISFGGRRFGPGSIGDISTGSILGEDQQDGEYENVQIGNNENSQQGDP